MKTGALARLLAAAAIILAILAGPAFASGEGFLFSSGTLSKEAPGETPGLYVSADFSISLPAQADESLRRGVPLYFVYEFTLHKKKWYWSDKEISSVSRTRRLSYSLLTRRFHIGGEGLSVSYPTLESALKVLSSVSHWRVAEPDAVTGKFQDYSARIRISLDTSRLPRPMQIGAAEWEATSEWVNLPISPTAVAP